MNDATPAGLAQLLQQGWKKECVFAGERGSGKTRRAERRRDELISRGFEAFIEETPAGDVLYTRAKRSAP